MEPRKRMEELVELLNKAGRAYYQEAREIMTNKEYDALYDELEQLEKETNVVLANSPTVHVGYEVVSALQKERHESPMLSLDKTKEVGKLIDFLGTQKALLSWKLDGLTIVLTYQDGELKKAVTRGNGEVGEIVTSNARTFVNLPLKIPYQGQLILRGEAVIGYRDFERINATLKEEAVRYKNPRNLCSGSVRQLNSEVTANRHVRFLAFQLVSAPTVDFENSRARQMEWLKEQGFETVEYHMVDRSTIVSQVEWFSQKIKENDFPSDGLVLAYEDIAYGKSLGRTAKFPRDSFAYKWADEVEITTLRKILWSPSRTGLINPVAIFDPVELEGTTVSRASVHNVSMVEELALGVGDQIKVYKANMIIPQIEENMTRSGTCQIPSTCPACGGPTQIMQMADAKTLFCSNEDCEAKHIKSFGLFVSRDGMNIEGLSEATLEKIIGQGLLHSYGDLFRLKEHQEQLESLEGFGKKSIANLLANIEEARKTTWVRLLYSLGIPGIGLANAKVIVKEYAKDPLALTKASEEELAKIEGIGPILAKAVVDYFAKEENQNRLRDLLKELTIEEVKEEEESAIFAGKVFVITGTVEHFDNRGKAKEWIEKRGGKVTGSVTKNTDYLVNNDALSTSSKNQKAKQLGVPVITEEELLQMGKDESTWNI